MTSITKILKFGFVGYGSIAKKHINAISTLYTNAHVIVVRRNCNEKIEEYNNLTISCTTNLEDLNTVDFIFITNPTALHIDVIKQVIIFKKPLFIEKPLAHNLGDISLLISEIKIHDIATYIACNLRFHTGLLYLKSLIGDIRINEVNVYCGSYLPEWRKEIDYKQGYSANAKLGGGVHLDLIHEVDYCYFLFGNPKNTNVFLFNNSSLQVDAVDYAHYFWNYDLFSLQITLNYFRRDYKRTIEIVADDATYILDIKENQIKKGDVVIFDGDKSFTFMYENQIDYFVNCVTNNKKCFNDIEEAFHVLKLCLNGFKK